MAPEVDPLGLAERGELAQAVTLAARLPDLLAEALAALPAVDSRDLLDRRLLVAALEPDYLSRLDGTLLHAALAGLLSEAAAFFGALLQTQWPAPAVMMLEGWFDDRMGAGD